MPTATRDASSSLGVYEQRRKKLLELNEKTSGLETRLRRLSSHFGPSTDGLRNNDAAKTAAPTAAADSNKQNVASIPKRQRPASFVLTRRTSSLLNGPLAANKHTTRPQMYSNQTAASTPGVALNSSTICSGDDSIRDHTIAQRRRSWASAMAGTFLETPERILKQRDSAVDITARTSSTLAASESSNCGERNVNTVTPPETSVPLSKILPITVGILRVDHIGRDEKIAQNLIVPNTGPLAHSSLMYSTRTIAPVAVASMSEVTIAEAEACRSAPTTIELTAYPAQTSSLNAVSELEQTDSAACGQAERKSLQAVPTAWHPTEAQLPDRISPLAVDCLWLSSERRVTRSHSGEELLPPEKRQRMETIEVAIPQQMYRLPIPPARIIQYPTYSLEWDESSEGSDCEGSSHCYTSESDDDGRDPDGLNGDERRVFELYFRTKSRGESLDEFVPHVLDTISEYSCEDEDEESERGRKCHQSFEWSYDNEGEYEGVLEYVERAFASASQNGLNDKSQAENVHGSTANTEDSVSTESKVPSVLRDPGLQPYHTIRRSAPVENKRCDWMIGGLPLVLPEASTGDTNERATTERTVDMHQGDSVAGFRDLSEASDENNMVEKKEDTAISPVKPPPRRSSLRLSSAGCKPPSFPILSVASPPALHHPDPSSQRLSVGTKAITPTTSYSPSMIITATPTQENHVFSARTLVVAITCLLYMQYAAHGLQLVRTAANAAWQTLAAASEQLETVRYDDDDDVDDGVTSSGGRTLVAVGHTVWIAIAIKFIWDRSNSIQRNS
ncbi:hypothetical protein DFJ77DRAFT_548473 [Powellomyces hirtus]|nr:hypothetical protein DFJ77DRAFT_548473 [Powellomyces hirtus]